MVLFLPVKAFLSPSPPKYLVNIGTQFSSSEPAQLRDGMQEELISAPILLIFSFTSSRPSQVSSI